MRSSGQASRAGGAPGSPVSTASTGTCSDGDRSATPLSARGRNLSRVRAIHAGEHVFPARIEAEDDLGHRGGPGDEAFLCVQVHGALVRGDGVLRLLHAQEEVAFSLRPAGLRGLERGQTVIVPGLWYRLNALLMRLLPAQAVVAMSARSVR